MNIKKVLSISNIVTPSTETINRAFVTSLNRIVAIDEDRNEVNYTDTITPKVYRAFLNQAGVGAPVPNILENTIGNIVWSYSAVGEYRATLNGVFVFGKTIVKPPTNWSPAYDALGGRMVFTGSWFDVNSIYIESGAIDNAGVASRANSLLFDGYSYVEIIILP